MSATPMRLSRVALTRDDGPGDALAGALRAAGVTVVRCPVLVEAVPADPQALVAAARSLERYHWVIVASPRAVRALTHARGGPWPADLRTAAVGPATAQAIAGAGVTRPVRVAARPGADALWAELSGLPWEGVDVLVTTAPEGRTVLADGLRAHGARVHAVEAYRMEPRASADIVHDWQAAAPDAVVLASARAARALIDAIGVAALADVRAIALGGTTAAALEAAGVRSERPDSPLPTAAVAWLTRGAGATLR